MDKEVKFTISLFKKVTKILPIEEDDIMYSSVSGYKTQEVFEKVEEFEQIPCMFLEKEVDLVKSLKTGKYSFLEDIKLDDNEYNIGYGYYCIDESGKVSRDYISYDEKERDRLVNKEFGFTYYDVPRVVLQIPTESIDEEYVKAVQKAKKH